MTVKGVPPQATEALTSIIVIELSSMVQQGMLLFGFIGIMLALIYKILLERYIQCVHRSRDTV